MSNLWDLSNIPVIKTPSSILREQGEYLSEATSGLLVGEVARHSRIDRLYYYLDVVAPALNDYRYTILEISHGVEPYPVEVHSEAAEVREECRDEDDFLKLLKAILASEKIKSVISSLLSQSRA